MESFKVADAFIKLRLGYRGFGLFILVLVIALVISGTVMAWRSTEGISGFPIGIFLISFFAASLLCVPSLVYDFFWCRTLVYKISNDRIEMKGGILRTIDRVTDVNRVTDVTIYQDFWGKMLGFSSVGFQTAGSYFTEIVFMGVSYQDATKIREMIYSKLGKKV